MSTNPTEIEKQIMEVYTFTEIDSPFYTIPLGCTELLSVKSLRYSGEYEDIDFIKVTKGDELVGFSLYILFDAKVEKGIKVTYK